MIDEHDWSPLDEEAHEAQVAGVLARLAGLGRPARIIDLGAGGGRMAEPLHEAGHDVVAIDRDPESIAVCEVLGVRTRRADLLDAGADLTHPAGPADCVLCLGNTFALVHDVVAAVGLLARSLKAVGPGGWLAIDAVGPLWEEVADGNWQAGDSEDGRWRLVWAPGDAVIAVRDLEHRDDDPGEGWDLQEEDTPCRLWSMGALRLAALASGWGDPVEHTGEHLVVFLRPSGP